MNNNAVFVWQVYSFIYKLRWQKTGKCSFAALNQAAIVSS